MEALRTILTKAHTNSYIGEFGLSQLEHAILAAQEAENDFPNEPAIIAAALLHDIGHQLEGDTMTDEDGQILGIQSHEDVGADYLKTLGFDDSVCEPVRNHVKSKRYLVSTDPEYVKTLSDASTATLTLQGGTLTFTEIKEFKAGKYFERSLLIRKYDELAKDKSKLQGYDIFTLLEKYLCVADSLLHLFKGKYNLYDKYLIIGRYKCGKDKDIEPVDLVELANLLKRNNKVEIFRVYGNKFDEDGISALAEMFRVNTTISLVDITCQYTEMTSLTNFVDALAVNQTVEYLAFCGKVPIDWMHVFNKINHRVVVDIRCYCNDQRDLDTLAHLIETNASPRQLTIGCSNGLDIICLFNALKINTSLVLLDIQRINFGDKGAIALAEAIKTHPTLQDLNIYCTGIERSGFVALFKALETNESIEYLDIGSNNILCDGDDLGSSDEAIRAFGSAIEHNKKLQSIKLAYLNLYCYKELVVDLLLNALKTNTTFCYFSTLDSGLDHYPKISLLTEYFDRNKKIASGEGDTKPARLM